MSSLLTISLGNDHAGYPLRAAVEAYLRAHNMRLIDHGTHSQESVDYPDFAKLVGLDIQTKQADFGILICSSGIGMSISANKIQGVRAALVQNEDNAEYSRKHNNANIICLGAKYIQPKQIEALLNIFLHTQFEGNRHQIRIDKINLL